MATIGEMIVKLIADTGNFNTDMAEAATTVKASQDAMASSMQTSMQAFRDFDAIQKGSISTAEDLAQAQATLNAVRSTGAFTSEELAAKESIVAAAMAKVGEDAKAAGAAMSGFTTNSRTMYSASALITDALTGQYGRMRREVAALANETGVMSAAFRAAIGPMGATAAAAGLIAIALVKGAEQSSKFADSLIATGNYAGTTEGAMNDLAQSIEGGSITIGDAREAVLQFAESGRFTHDQLQSAAQAAASFASVADVSMSEAVQAIIRIQEDPVAALQKLNEQYHFVNQAQLDAVASLVKQGETTKAVSLAIEDFGNVMHTRAMQAAQDVGYMERAWEGLKAVISDTVNWMEAAGRKVTLQAQLEEADHDLQLIQTHGETVGRMIIGMEATGSKLFSNPANYTVDKLTAKVEGLKAQIAAANKEAEGQGNATGADTTTKRGVDISALEQQFQEQEAATHASYDQMKEDAADFWNEQATNASNSTAVQAEAWQRYIQARHQLDQQGLEQERATDRQSEEAEKKANAQKLQSLEQIRNATKEASQERIDADLKVVQYAIKAYGQQSSQFGSALRQMEDDAKAFEQKQKELSERDLDNAHAATEKKTEIAIQGYKLEAKEGQITAAQLLRDQIDALNQQLAADIRYYQQKAKLAAADAAEQAKWNALIVTDTKKTEDQMLKAAEAYQNSINRIYDQIYERKKQDDQRMIESGFREVNSILMRQETLKQALANLGMQILENEEQQIAKSIAAHWAAEQAKTAATITGNMTRVAADEAGQAQSLLVQGEAAVKWIITEAAKAAAGAFNAMVSIPYVGPFLAVGASVAAFAAVAKLVGSVASAEGGWERVPADGMMTELHRDEMVLPKHVADPMRKAARGGMGGGGDNYHFHMQDARGLQDFVRRNRGALSSAAQRARRNGYR